MPKMPFFEFVTHRKKEGLFGSFLYAECIEALHLLQQHRNFALLFTTKSQKSGARQQSLDTVISTL